MLEQRIHDGAHFITLTYDDLHLPSDGSVRPRELQLFLKRLREKTDERIRYYAVGEYGDISSRPHYHLALFGLAKLPHINAVDAHMFGLPPCECVLCKAWTKGSVDRGDLTAQSAAYIVSYVAKGLTKEDHPELGNRYREFARMSRKPGIGADAMPVIAKALGDGRAEDYREGSSRVPHQYRSEGRLWPLGRYLSRKLREEMGVPDAAHRIHVDGYQKELQSDLQAPGARAQRESKRLQVGRSAVVRNKIRNSKKGIGI